LITGGPGTGKTYTAARILALLTHQHDGERPLRVRLSAPTGKAAARLGESIRQARAAMPPGTFLNGMIVDEACTLDRLLGRQRQESAYRHHADCQLEADVVIVDEASMVDLAKMARLLDALPAQARLVLLGDRHQLSAVAPGSVLAAICAAPAIAPAVVELTESRRFASGGAIARFSAAVNTAHDAGAAARAVALLADAEAGMEDAVGFVEAPPVLKTRQGGVELRFAQAVLRGYRDFLDAQTPAAAFPALAGFRVLCALRRGPLGAEQVNALIEEILSLRGLQGDKLPPDCRPAHALAPSGTFYPHRVLMITQNDYATGLFNGDVGIVLPSADDPTRLAVYFEQPADAEGGHYRCVPSHLLPAHETAFAITVHKSQGSEFGHVLVLLPPTDSPVVTRELIYTAVTRTRSGVTLWGGRESLTAAMQRTVRRFSGLFC
jgi:exodeoxyribonuclease V alpha subunit